MSARLHAALDSENLTAEPINFFDSRLVEDLICTYQQTGSVQTLGEIITHCQPISLSLIRSRGTAYYQEEEELLSSIDRKLLVSLPQYDSHRGSAFSFVSRLSINMLKTAVTHRKKLASRYQHLDEFLAASTPDENINFHSAIALDDLTQQIRSIKSSCTLESERQAQCWFVESFIDSAFEMRRHQCSDAAMKVYGLSHRRSRQLYDLTLLEIRRGALGGNQT